jgi:choline dehydrogenase-like flavoprotein
MGTGTGGSTNLYAAQLERMYPEDFEPKKNYPDDTQSSLPERWPIPYEEIVPYYRAAEKLFGVSGTPDPLNPDPDISLIPPPPLSDRDQDIFDSFEELGLHPYRAHAGFRHFDGCSECGARLCPLGCKRDAGTVALLPALESHGAKLLTDCEVVRFEALADCIETVHCRIDGQDHKLRARIVVLAAGAYLSPKLLLDSQSRDWPEGLANRSGAVGRNLMLHATDFFTIRPRRPLSDEGPLKAISVNDFYIHNGVKLGTFQSMGIAVTPGTILFYLRRRALLGGRLRRTLMKPFLRLITAVAGSYYRGATLFASNVEDLPYWNNRITSDGGDGMRFEYSYPKELVERTRMMRTLIKSTLGKRHNTRVVSDKFNLNWGHVCGTCRFGSDPTSSVLDHNCRAHDVANLYVTDASFFPSSAGINPSLTIAANALRVADAIVASDRSNA